MSLCFFVLGLGAGGTQPLVRQTLPRRVWAVGMAGFGVGLVGTCVCGMKEARQATDQHEALYTNPPASESDLGNPVLGQDWRPMQFLATLSTTLPLVGIEFWSPERVRTL